MNDNKATRNRDGGEELFVHQLREMCVKNGGSCWNFLKWPKKPPNRNSTKGFGPILLNQARTSSGSNRSNETLLKWPSNPVLNTALINAAQDRIRAAHGSLVVWAKQLGRGGRRRQHPAEVSERRPTSRKQDCAGGEVIVGQVLH